MFMADKETFIDQYARNNVEGRKEYPKLHGIALAVAPGLQLAEDAACDSHVKKLEEQRKQEAGLRTR
jgi:hypothetical protein